MNIYPFTFKYKFYITIIQVQLLARFENKQNWNIEFTYFFPFDGYNFKKTMETKRSTCIIKWRKSISKYFKLHVSTISIV